MLRRHPMARKRLLTAAPARGQMWLERAARLCGAVHNVAAGSLETWAVERLKPALARERIRFVTRAETKWIVYRLLQEMAGEPGTYGYGTAVTPGVAETFHRAVLELRGAGMRAEAFRPEDLEPAAKGRYVQQLLQRFEAALVRQGLVDLAGLLPIAERLSSMPASGASAPAERVIVDPQAVRTAVQHRLLIALTGGVYNLLPVETGFTEPGSGFPAASAQLFHALGPLAEAREVVRRITERGLPWDQVELIVSGRDPGVLAVHTVLELEGCMCTYAEGLPLRSTRVGKAALLYLEWVETGFRLEPLLTGLKQGVLAFSGDRPKLTAARAIRELERSGIGWGRARYRLLDRLSAEPGLPEERAADLRELSKSFERLLLPLTEETLASPADLLRALIDFTERHAVRGSEADRQALDALEQLERSLLPAGPFGLPAAMALRCVRESVEELRVLSAGTPSPGRLHVSTPATGGQSGRAYTFVLGMTEEAWSVPLRQDPVLLDEERRRLSPWLLPSSELARREAEERNSRLGQIRGECTLSCAREVGREETRPAFELLQVFRTGRGRPEADYETLLRELGMPIGYFASRTGLAMDAAEVWMRSLVSPRSQLADGRARLWEAYPFLGRGERAAQARLAPESSVYDGLLHGDRHPITLPGDAGNTRTFSASQLELYGRCPLQYFYRELLGVRAKETDVYDRSSWLDPRQRGSLLHAIFEEYFMRLRELRSGDPEAGYSLPHDRALLDAIAGHVLARYTADIPAPTDHVLRKETESILRDVHVFYISEARRTASVPVLTELRLHSGAAPLRLQLDDTFHMPLAGYVDRVDAIGPHRYAIVDYKTGRPRKYGPHDRFAAGTQLQLPLYGLAVEQWMRETGYDAEAEVADSFYYFPTERGMGEEVRRPQDRREELAGLLRSMLNAMREGLYPPAADPRSCTSCDYKAVCGGHASQFEAKRQDPANAERLATLLEVNRYA